MKQHKWHKEIKAWADGAEIEIQYIDRKRHCDEWSLMVADCWNDDEFNFRIKPQPKEKKYLYAYIDTRFGKIEFSTEWDKNSEMPLIGKIEVQDD